MAFNPATAKYVAGFNPKNLVHLGTTISRGDETPIVTYQNEFKGKPYVHVRGLWANDDGEWNVGKGISMPPDVAAKVFAALGKLASPQPVKAVRKVSA